MNQQVHYLIKFALSEGAIGEAKVFKGDKEYSTNNLVKQLNWGYLIYIHYYLQNIEVDSIQVIRVIKTEEAFEIDTAKLEQFIFNTERLCKLVPKDYITPTDVYNFKGGKLIKSIVFFLSRFKFKPPTKEVVKEPKLNSYTVCFTATKKKEVISKLHISYNNYTPCDKYIPEIEQEYKVTNVKITGWWPNK